MNNEQYFDYLLDNFDEELFKRIAKLDEEQQGEQE